MDEDTALTILNCQLEDVLASIELRKTTQKQGETTDVQDPLVLQAAELKATIDSFKDRRMCQSMSRAIQDDFPVLAAEFALERQGERDREQALELTAGESGEGLTSRRDSVVSSGARSELPSEEDISRLASFNFFRKEGHCSLICDHNSNDDNANEGTSSLPARQCSSCTSTLPASQTYTASCAHIYCHDCLTQLFHDGLKDQELFPARCCRQEMPLSSVSSILGADLTYRVEMKLLEHSTVNKIYCGVRTCSTFIKPYEILDNRGTCSACGAETCAQCREVAHEGACEEGKEDEDLLELAKAEGWRECYRCHAMVELGIGCYHMT